MSWRAPEMASRSTALTVNLSEHREALRMSAVYAGRRGDYEKADHYWKQVEETDARLAAGEEWEVFF